MRVLILAAVAASFFFGSAFAQRRAGPAFNDEFHWLNEFNKASTVMVVEQGIVSRELGSRIADGVAKVIADGAKPGAKRPGDYLAYEPLLLAYAGPDATRMHSGRSRQDIIPTNRRVMLRERTLALMQAMVAARQKLLETAGQHTKTIVPGYTNGVQAQPTTYGHYLLGFASAYSRHGERLRQAYARLNQNPLGVAVYGTSSFPVNRVRLAELLGFDGNVENGYDAAQLSIMDVPVEIDSVAAFAALTTASMTADAHTQYHQTSPWLLIREGAETHGSSIMPQKRNPTVLNNLRLSSSLVVGDAQGTVIVAHNVPPGMPDYKRDHSHGALEGAITMFGHLQRYFENLAVNVPVALAEVNKEYSTTTELADVLQREADIPFRIGHHFASELVTFGRKAGVGPGGISYRDAKQVWAEAAKKYGAPPVFPLTEKRFRESLSAEGMLAASRGLGGPQPAEVARMLESEKQKLAADVEWLQAQRGKLEQAQANLDKAFASLAAPGAGK
ncbi:lyase family protein [Usitatibacter palustris]|uniref:argininosuccinate lyase n=1 Tax=Usitatibacter palustris TaxID=2732487 RepID=A0A6M4H896_9PROT|nr:lyase family protein [Usitatibacter palustris]QJR15919.1 Argininosuccinate lyase [Usitatibacter palustris]